MDFYNYNYFCIFQNKEQWNTFNYYYLFCILHKLELACSVLFCQRIIINVNYTKSRTLSELISVFRYFYYTTHNQHCNYAVEISLQFQRISFAKFLISFEIFYSGILILDLTFTLLEFNLLLYSINKPIYLARLHSKYFEFVF